MKILILSFYYEPDLCAGSFRCKALVDALQEKLDSDSCIDIVTTRPNRYASFNVTAPEMEVNGNTRIFRIALPAHQSGMLDQSKAFLHYYFNAMKIARNEKYDLVFATSSRLFTAFLGSRYATKYKLPLYLDIRDIFVDTIEDMLPKFAKIFIVPVLKLIERATFIPATRVNLVSPGFLPYFKAKYPTLDYDPYTNGIDEVFYENAMSPNVNSGKANGETKTIVLYAGNVGESQGLHNIVPGLAECLQDENCIIRVIGDGGRKAKLVDLIEQKKCTNVELLPPITRQELVEEYKQADILFCHLNDAKAFEKVLPSKVFEYAAFNKPIIAGVSGQAAQFLKENLSCSEVFTPCNAQSAYAAFKAIGAGKIDNSQFLEKYRRRNIMSEMANSVISVVADK